MLFTYSVSYFNNLASNLTKYHSLPSLKYIYIYNLHDNNEKVILLKTVNMMLFNSFIMVHCHFKTLAGALCCAYMAFSQFIIMLRSALLFAFFF